MFSLGAFPVPNMSGIGIGLNMDFGWPPSQKGSRRTASSPLLQITNEPLLPRKPAAGYLPLPLRVNQLNLIAAHQGRHDLIYLHVRQVPPDTDPRTSSKGQVTGVVQPQPLLVVLVRLGRAPEPPLRPELVGVLAPDGLVAARDVRVDTDGRVGWDEGPVG